MEKSTSFNRKDYVCIDKVNEFETLSKVAYENMIDIVSKGDEKSLAKRLNLFGVVKEFLESVDGFREEVSHDKNMLEKESYKTLETDLSEINENFSKVRFDEIYNYCEEHKDELDKLRKIVKEIRSSIK